MFNRYTHVHGDPINRRDFRGPEDDGMGDPMADDDGGGGGGGTDSPSQDLSGDPNSGGSPTSDNSSDPSAQVGDLPLDPNAGNLAPLTPQPYPSTDTGPNAQLTAVFSLNPSDTVGNLPINTEFGYANIVLSDPCVTNAVVAGALSVGIDAIGLIPEAGGVARVIGHQAGYVGVVADQAGRRVVKAVGGAASAGQGLAGVSDTSPEGLFSAGLTIAGFIPIVSDFAAVASIGVDIYKTGKAIGNCP